MDSEENLTRDDAIEKLQMIKSYIDSEIVGNDYDDIIRLNFFRNSTLYEIIIIDDNLDNGKEIPLNQLMIM